MSSIKPYAALISTITLLAAVACGGTTFTEQPSDGGIAGSSGAAGSGGVAGGAGTGGIAGSGGIGGSGGIAGGAGSGGAAGAGAGPITDYCPSPNASSCTPEQEGHVCWYGDDPRPECRTRIKCENGQLSGIAVNCIPFSTEGCPADPDNVPSNFCKHVDQSKLCSYPDGVYCGCQWSGGAPPPDGDGSTWQCASPPQGDGCPQIAPNPGTACAVEGANCSYGFTCSSFLFGCHDGIWMFDGQAVCAQAGDQDG